jgi:hypothetical protein
MTDSHSIARWSRSIPSTGARSRRTAAAPSRACGDTARVYLKEPGFASAHIAWLLGYEGPTSFNHAFRRWTGHSPSAARRDRNQAAMPLPDQLRTLIAAVGLGPGGLCEIILLRRRAGVSSRRARLGEGAARAAEHFKITRAQYGGWSRH